MQIIRPAYVLSTTPSLSILAVLISTLLLNGCGGGGGGGGGGSSETVVPAPTPAPTPSTPVATSSKVKVGIVDSGLAADRSEFNYADIHFTSSLAGASQTLNDNQGHSGHGTVVALTLAGLAEGSFTGGVAPDSELWIAQASSNNLFYYTDTQKAINGLLSNGVKIINMSYASDERLTTSAELASAGQSGRYDALRDSLSSIVNANALGVVVTGNNGSSTPSPNAQVPLIYNDASLQKGLIAVTGYLPGYTVAQGSRPPELYVFDACGDVAAWCLAAPGYADYLQDDGTLARKYGTSFSAPRVAGAASRVSAQFPWMTGYNLQQTLLTTADYHSDAVAGAASDSANGRPYNDTFGWGNVNVDRALNGPGMFYGDDFTAALSAGNYIFSNNISGNGGLIVSGASDAGGVLTLTGNNTYTGATRVQSNSLYIDGSVASDVQVTGSGVLAGKGNIGGNLSNQGSVVTTSAGALHVVGSYQQSADGTLRVTLSQPLTVAGPATLNGALQVTLPSNTYIVQTSESLLQSGQGISGQFASVDTGVFLQGSVDYSANSVNGHFQRVNTVQAAQAAGLSGATLKSAANVEQAFQVADSYSTQAGRSAQQEDLLQNAAALQQIGSSAAARAALDSLSGQAHASGNAILFNSLDYQNQLLSNRLDPAQQKPYGLWAETGTLHGDLQQDGYLGSHYRINTTAIGLDSSFDITGLRLGAAITDSQIRADYDGSGGNSTNSLQGLMLYGQYAVTPAWIWQANLSYQHGDTQLYRVLLVDGVQATSAETRNDSWQGLIKTGYRWSLNDRLTLEPYAGMKLSQLYTGGFSDEGSALGLQGDSARYSRTVGLTGLNLSAPLFTVQQWWSMLSVYGEYQHAFTNPSLDVNAKWVGTGSDGQSFAIPGMTLDRDSQWYGLRLDIGKAKDARLFLRMDKHIADRGDESVFRGGVDIAF
ncbi:autotransporter domain-containing protein [Pantoea sp. BAV 3049]|uniref:S8 family peptidase n=1 Tax=Pantoea sp. BAV 3049 TaxID=2654188 RepID=UPI001E58B776|nr:autotransporter domain-containing protein [Pantoea sp. BAV 3049]